jgi:hypothetical protein
MMYASIIADNPDSIAHTGMPDGSQCPLMPITACHNQLQLYLKHNNVWNGSGGYCTQHVNMITQTGYGTGAGPSGFIFPFPEMMLYEGGISDVVPPAVSITTKVVRSGLSHDFMYHKAMADSSWAVDAHFSQPGPAGTIGFTQGCLTTGITPRSFDANHSYTCPDGADSNSCELWANAGTWQGESLGDGTNNHFWAPTLGGDLFSHDVDNQPSQRYGHATWTLGIVPPPPPPPSPVASFSATPLQIPSASNISQLITLSGSLTRWTSSSAVSVVNSLTGTTTVMAGAFSASTPTSATLSVTTGAGVGTWRIVVDGIDGPVMSTQPPTVIIPSTLTIVVAGLLGTQLVTQGLGMSVPVIVPQMIGADPSQGYMLIDTTTPAAADPQGGKLVV